MSFKQLGIGIGIGIGGGSYSHQTLKLPIKSQGKRVSNGLHILAAIAD